MNAGTLLRRSALAVAGALVSAIVIGLTSRAVFVAGGSDAATVIWGPTVAPGLLVVIMVVCVAGIAVTGGAPRAVFVVFWLLVLGIATHRVAFDAPSGRVDDRWFGVAVRSQTFADEQVSGLRRCAVVGAAAICAVGRDVAFRSITLLPAGPLVADADGLLVPVMPR